MGEGQGHGRSGADFPDRAMMEDALSKYNTRALSAIVFSIVIIALIFMFLLAVGCSSLGGIKQPCKCAAEAQCGERLVELDKVNKED